MKEVVNGLFVVSFIGCVGTIINFFIELGRLLMSKNVPSPSTILWSGGVVIVALVVLLTARYFSDMFDVKGSV